MIKPQNKKKIIFDQNDQPSGFKYTAMHVPCGIPNQIQEFLFRKCIENIVCKMVAVLTRS